MMKDRLKVQKVIGKRYESPSQMDRWSMPSTIPAG